jgi:xanthine dehydrogenase YagS FAD-binding subunit
VTPLRYERPLDFAAALDALTQPGSAPLGGGTDLLVALREGLIQPDCLVDLRALPEANDLRTLEDGSLHVGAAVTIAAIAGNGDVRERFTALAMACDAVGSPALRNMGTIGGNLCQRPRCWYFRSGMPCLKSGGTECPAVEGRNEHLAILGGGPCHAVHPSDPAVALTALEAIVHVRSADAERAVPIDAFFIPPSVDPRRETVLAPGEVVTAISIPASSSGGRQRFMKLLQRGAWDFALASIAVVKREDGAVRLVLGGVAPVPWRVNPSVEEDIAAGDLVDDDFDALAARALYDARPLSANGYKVDLAQALLRDAMAFASSR